MWERWPIVSPVHGRGEDRENGRLKHAEVVRAGSFRTSAGGSGWRVEDSKRNNKRLIARDSGFGADYNFR